MGRDESGALGTNRANLGTNQRRAGTNQRREPSCTPSAPAAAIMFERLKEAGFDVVALHHAEAILAGDMPDAVTELEDVLSAASVQ